MQDPPDKHLRQVRGLILFMTCWNKTMYIVVNQRLQERGTAGGACACRQVSARDDCTVRTLAGGHVCSKLSQKQRLQTASWCLRRTWIRWRPMPPREHLPTTRAGAVGSPSRSTYGPWARTSNQPQDMVTLTPWPWRVMHPRNGPEVLQ